MANRLENSASLYLRQHAHQPVDWYPWGEEAFALARELNRPVFLSVGYSSCHWCHVMAHESFDDLDVAQILNESFVSIKVDREERPDVDETYMTAVQLASGRGGWPMSLFLTPDKRPFFAGTYFPKNTRGQVPGFLEMCRNVALVWKTQRAEIEKSAVEFATSLTQVMNRDMLPSTGHLNDELLDRCVEALIADFDSQHGGFGGAPKFPPHSALKYLLKYAAEEKRLAPDARRIAISTLEHICLGGIHDHVGGGFHRYSTDGEWHLPHFEKMLSDNALLLEVLAIAIPQSLGATRSLFESAQHRLIVWLKREMTSPTGLFYSALDADTDGHEGKTYVWTPQEVGRLLGAQAPEFLTAYQFHPEGNFLEEATGQRTGENVLHLAAADAGSFDAALDALLVARNSRPQPVRDEKAIASWNGLMIRALAVAGEIELAKSCADQWVAAHRRLEFLPHMIADGQPGSLGFLDDYAAMANALYVLAGVTQEETYHHAARVMLGDLQDLFWDEEEALFLATSVAHEPLFGRPRPILDQAVPSAHGMAIAANLRAGHTGVVGKALHSALGWMERVPTATESLHECAMHYLRHSTSDELRDESLARMVAVEQLAEEVRVRMTIPLPPGHRLNQNENGDYGLKVQLEGALPVRLAIDATHPRQAVIDLSFALAQQDLPSQPRLRMSYQLCTDRDCQPYKHAWLALTPDSLEEPVR
jgi:uncharacterized protein YyaL (SSP411 family)